MLQACERELSIARYAVIPLSPNVGLIGWVPNCDTMHQLIRDYRESTNIAINLEHQLMKSFAPNYDNLQLIQKIEVFEHALDSTEGDDLRKVSFSAPPYVPLQVFLMPKSINFSVENPLVHFIFYYCTCISYRNLCLIATLPLFPFLL